MNNNNMESFLQNIINITKEDISKKPTLLKSINTRPNEKLTTLNQNELVTALIENAKNMAGTDSIACNISQINESITKIVERFGEGNIISGLDDELNNYLNEKYKKSRWSETKDINNISNIKYGIIPTSVAAAETGTVMFETSKHCGLSLAIMPEILILIIRKSTIKPNMHNLMTHIDEKYENQDFSAQIELISGPSSTADIELIRVVGVHGPVAISYIILNDI